MENQATTTNGLELLLVEYKKEIKKYLDKNAFYINDDARLAQYNKCLTIASCCKILGMTEDEEQTIVSNVRFELHINNY